MKDFEFGTKELKDLCKMINSHLSTGKNWLVGDRLTMADMAMFVPLNIAFSTVLDGGFRKAMTHVTAWFERMRHLPVVAGVCGYVKMCEKAIKPIDPASCVKVEAEIKPLV